MNPDGGLVFADGPGRFRLAGYTPPFDVPPVACTPCPGVSQPGCCQHRPTLNLVLAPDQPRRRWPWQKRARQ